MLAQDPLLLWEREAVYLHSLARVTMNICEAIAKAPFHSPIVNGSFILVYRLV